jgi:3-oxoacyl-[acyl-carrier protein] reductase
MPELNGKTALVTGAAQVDGIGFAAARALAMQGAHVVISDLGHNEAQLSMLQQRVAELREEKLSAEAIAMDISDPESVTQCFEKIKADHQALHILFNNAATPVGVGPFMDISIEQWQQTLQINVLGTVYCCRAAVPLMQEEGGSIINNSSLAGLGAIPDMSAYTTSKFAVVGFSKSLATELGQQGIRVNAVCPGMVWTQMGRMETEISRREGESLEEAKARLADPSLVPLARWALPREIADAVVYLASERSAYVNGIALPVAGGIAPGL